MACRIFLADDQSCVRKTVRRLLEHEPDLKVVNEAHDGALLLEQLRSTPVAPDLIIMDISMPTVNGIEATREIRALYPMTQVLILTMHSEEDYLDQALSAGAAGYLTKDDAGQDLVKAIRCIGAGGMYISPCFSQQVVDRIRSARAASPQSADVDPQNIAGPDDLPPGESGDDEHPKKPAA